MLKKKFFNLELKAFTEVCNLDKLIKINKKKDSFFRQLFNLII